MPYITRKNTIRSTLRRTLLALTLLFTPAHGLLAADTDSPDAGSKATEKPPLDSVLMLDSSGSMKFTDPNELRKPAAKLFIQLLGKQDRTSVVSFSSQAWPITFLSQLENPQQVEQALVATDKISHKGAYTNIHAALSKGLELLENSQQLQREPILILMSDGKIDVGDNAKSAMLRQQIISELLPQLVKHNIKVYSIAFTEASDQQLMQQIADVTNGRYALAASDDVLHKVFSKIFEQAKEPNMLPLDENRFVVDESISEVTIIANKKSEKSKIELKSPQGNNYSASQHSANINWFVSSSFDMITVQKPQVGEWSILFSDDDNRAYIVADIKLRTQFELDRQSPQPELILRAWFEQDQQTEANQALLRNMQVSLEIEHPDGRIETLPVNELNDAGEFVVHFKPDMNGFYGATMIATSKTFQRQQTFSFRNTLPEVLPEEQPEEPLADSPTEATSTETEAEAETTAEEPAAVEEPDLATALLYFGLFNLLLLIIAVNGFFIYRHFKKNKPEQSDAD
ncbi:MAG TPA: vWA domain-containing protein [Gammaproteobacteria bacterium]